jgi:hypothetical protein
LHAALAWSDGKADSASRGWRELQQAVSYDDKDLWTVHVDDLQRILAYALTRGDGPAVRKWMEDSAFKLKYAPLYHAFCAAMDGEDHLLLINPEVRGATAKIHHGLAQLHGVFEHDHGIRGRRAPRM